MESLSVLNRRSPPDATSRTDATPTKSRRPTNTFTFVRGPVDFFCGSGGGVFIAGMLQGAAKNASQLAGDRIAGDNATARINERADY